MKLSLKILLLFVFMYIMSCQNKQNIINHFSATNDTLVIRTVKQKGNGLFQLGVGGVKFKV
ncbi:MAG: hypothetical protein JKY44_04310 [Flavobacteriaceae bacterium]|nr:hypothetical protein [Flavobacteriaceae bacterium]